MRVLVGIPTGTFAQGKPNPISGLRPLYAVGSRSGENARYAKRPKYMEVRHLKTGDRYFWCKPSWARQAGCPIENQALGPHFETAANLARSLNDQLDKWREARRQILNGINA